MRTVVLGGVVSVALVMASAGTASSQISLSRTPAPPVTAESAPWQLNDEPIIFGGVPYFPTRETRFFDGQIMAELGVYRAVPIYADVTLEPYSVIYVPVERGLVRGYERRRDRDLAGTEGSRVSAFPIDLASPAPRQESPLPGSGGALLVRPASAELSSIPASASVPTRARIESIMQPVGANGVWLEFNGARWYSDGQAINYTADRFVMIGEYRGFPVYRDTTGSGERIWVASVKDGPLAPYVRR